MKNKKSLSTCTIRYPEAHERELGFNDSIVMMIIIGNIIVEFFPEEQEI